jgi:hypothetical protein
LAGAFGYRDVLVVSGIVYFGICLLTLTSSSVRDLPRRSQPVEPSGQLAG